MVSEHHQCPVDKASTDLLVIATPSGRYRLKMLVQGVDVFNIVTDGSTHLDSNLIKNMDYG